MIDDSEPSKGLQQRMTLDPNPIVSPLGGPYPEPMVELSDGTSVPESTFGAPPADLPADQWDEWYANRDEELVTEKML